MSLPQEVVQEVFQVIEGGATLGQPAEIIQFPTDNGQNVYNVVEKTYKGANGTGFNYWVVAFQTLVGETMMAVSAGAAMLACEVGMVGAAVAPALGITTGYVLYNLSPEFWNSVAEDLIEAGETINGKVVAFMNENGVLTFSENVIEIFKNHFIEAGIFDIAYEPEQEISDGMEIDGGYYEGYITASGYNNNIGKCLLTQTFLISSFSGRMFLSARNYTGVEDKIYSDFAILCKDSNGRVHMVNVWQREIVDFVNYGGVYAEDNGRQFLVSTINQQNVSSYDDQTYTFHHFDGFTSGEYSQLENSDYSESDIPTFLVSVAFKTTVEGQDHIQNGAVLPSADTTVDVTYPDWISWEFPDIDGQQFPDKYPLEYPELLPDDDPYQDDAQNPDDDTEEHPDIIKRTIEDPDNDPTNRTEDQTDDAEDPETGDEPDPIEDTGEDPVGPDPIDPDPDTPITPVIPVVTLPDTVDSSKLFTVYNPSQSQLDALGGYLWDDSLIETLKKIWQNPLDGVISLQQIFVSPSVGSSHNIILGYLDSGVSAPVVTSQFVTVDCGSVTVNELNKNCLDYVPYTQLQLYLPFIGVTEIDTNEFMEGTISVKYKVDVYTGSCIAEVKCTRTRDLANGAILYTFNGNCSQQLPLTSGDQKGLLQALIGAAGAGLSVAAGGEFGIMDGARMINSNIARGMYHVSHSGNLSANAGIMCQKKPYLIMNRERPYTANTYNKFYGFPANKTGFLGNHKGFLRLKAGRLRTAATENEKNEIYELLTAGVIM